MNNKRIDESELMNVNAGSDIEMTEAELIKNPEVLGNQSSSSVDSSSMSLITKKLIEIARKRQMRK
ncbi:MAG: hypothetical protein Q4A32_12125 [Lachnospiraceae bacterium]|nr:hypothetical protein [Lachnospiraceae bacterium]